jgi:vancomycin aglycone glucosyltransferase
LPLSTYSAPGGLRQGPRRTAESLADARKLRKQEIHEVHTFLSVHGSCGGIEPLVGIGPRLRAPGAESGKVPSPACAGLTSDRS